METAPISFAGRVWRLLVGIKDALVLALLLLFFSILYGALTARAGANAVHPGALLIRMNGAVVEEPSEDDTLSSVVTGGTGMAQLRERDVVRALNAAAGDARIKAVVMDLSRFEGAGLVHAEEIGAAMDAVRAAKKPVLVYGFVTEDAGTLIAAHASEAWVDPLGGAFLPGPGGYNLYYGQLLDRLKITAHIFRVGTYKDFVEPYFRNDESPPSKMARQALYDAVWNEIRANIAHARPMAKLAEVTGDPVGWFKANGGDGAQAALAAGLVDRVGTWADFGARVASIAGEDPASKRPGAFAHTGLEAYLADKPPSDAGKAIAVVTVAGDIVDGKAGPGTAGGTRIARLIDGALARKDVAALVVRVDSPGGSVTGAETIRQALMRARAKGLPVAISMANLAASGGYWVSTPGARIFARPGTITGSIGIFAVIPSFERLLGQYGVSGDGVRTTPLSGQPDVFTGLTPEVEAMLQAEIDNGYARFIGLVAKSRGKTPAQVDTIAQGRVWDGRTAKNIGLVDQFGGVDDAVAWAAGAARLDPGNWHAEDLGAVPRSTIGRMLAALKGDGDEDADGDADGSLDDGMASGGHDWAAVLAQHQREGLATAIADAQHILGSSGAQVACLECAALGAPRLAPRRSPITSMSQAAPPSPGCSR